MSNVTNTFTGLAAGFGVGGLLVTMPAMAVYGAQGQVGLAGTAAIAGAAVIGSIVGATVPRTVPTLAGAFGGGGMLSMLTLPMLDGHTNMGHTGTAIVAIAAVGSAIVGAKCAKLAKLGW